MLPPQCLLRGGCRYTDDGAAICRHCRQRRGYAADADITPDIVSPSPLISARRLCRRRRHADAYARYAFASAIFRLPFSAASPSPLFDADISSAR